MTKLYDKCDAPGFHIVNFPFISSNIPSAPVYSVYAYIHTYIHTYFTLHRVKTYFILLSQSMINYYLNVKKHHMLESGTYGRSKVLINCTISDDITT